MLSCKCWRNKCEKLLSSLPARKKNKMRITVNLNYFFQDHRCSAKIFINKNIETIQDLENRISEIFNIYDFYLKCDNQYLPSSEDVHILNHDDVVWALPKNEEQLLSERNLLTNCVEETGNRVRKKKNKKSELVVNEDSLDQYKRKKHKKKQREREESSEQSSEEIRNTKKKQREKEKSLERSEPEETFENKKKKRKKNKVPETTNCLESKDSGRDSLDNDLGSQSSSISVKSLVNTFENQKDLKKCLEHSFTPVLPKVNIVKTIIISHPKHNPNSETPNTSNITNDSSVPTGENEETSPPKTDEEISPTKIENSEKKSNEESDLMSSYCGSDPDVKNNYKRKRKRTRKSKRKPKPTEMDNSEISNSEVNNHLPKPEFSNLRFIPTPLIAKEASGRHVRFKEGSDVIPSPESTARKDDSNESKIVINEGSHNIEKNYSKDIVEPTKIIDLTKVIDNNELTEELIMKHPLMENIQPRNGDIIAFKIIRISDNYTPEVSSRIIGKVSNYNLERMDVTFDVLYGQDQFSQPQGKFSIDLNNETMQEETVDNNTFVCAWSSALDPRLLHP